MAIPPPDLQQAFAPPLNQNWTRRAFHASVVVGDWVYMHMGEVAVGDEPFSDSVDLDPTYDLKAVNATLSLHLASSWTDPKDLQFQAFPKCNSAVYKSSTLWYDPVKNEAFSFGGEQSFQDNSTATLQIEKLIPTNDGYGFWTRNATERNAPFSKPLELTRPVGGATAQSNTTGFWLGGYSSNRTSDTTKSLEHYVPTPSMVTYEFATSAWSNYTIDFTLPLGIPNGTIEWAGMEYIPTLGPNGMLVIWGGENSNTSVYEPGFQERPMSSIVLHDPRTRKWYLQAITGTAPSVRNRFCSVSVSDPSPAGNATGGSHEIYMFGGYAGVIGAGAQQYDEIWVLSIPAFTWQLLDASHTVARMGHTCHLVGKKQMLSIGGLNVALQDPWKSPDYNNWNGIGVFDLSQAMWTQGFDAAAAAYTRPRAVQNYYNSNPGYPSTWTMQSLGSLIVNNNASDTNNASLTGNPSSMTNNNFTNSHGAGIITGATIGGLLALVILTLILYLFFFRRSSLYNLRNQIYGYEIEPEMSELPGDYFNPRELPVTTKILWPQNAATLALSHVRGAGGLGLSERSRSRGRSRRRCSRSRGRYLVELDAGECAGELGRGGETPLKHPAPPAAHHRVPRLSIPSFRRGGGEAGDYFSLLRPRTPKSPRAVITPGVKEVPAAITPRIFHEAAGAGQGSRAGSGGVSGSMSGFYAHEESPPPPVPKIGENFLDPLRPPIFIRRALSRAGFSVSSPSDVEAARDAEAEAAISPESDRIERWQEQMRSSPEISAGASGGNGTGGSWSVSPEMGSRVWSGGVDGGKCKRRKGSRVREREIRSDEEVSPQTDRGSEQVSPVQEIERSWFAWRDENG